MKRLKLMSKSVHVRWTNKHGEVVCTHCENPISVGDNYARIKNARVKVYSRMYCEECARTLNIV